jgi:putative tryptophan/tyrosine transport system substrate-binding protein
MKEGPSEIAAAIDAAKKADAAALNVLASPLFFADRQVIMERATALHLPAMYHWPEVAEQGGLLGYGPRLDRVDPDRLHCLRGCG